MKKFILIVSTIVALLMFWDTAHYRLGWYLDLHPNQEVTTFMKTMGKEIYMKKEDTFEKFEIKGVNLGSGTPGEWSTDFAIDEETYQRWFKYIQEMGANTIRVYTIQADEFYNAFYDYNLHNENPLYLIHGVWVNDYIQNSHRDAYDKDFYDRFVNDCKTMLDVIHGNKKISLGRMASAGSGTYNHDISPWVIGYILGVEWEDVTVAYTDEKYGDDERYRQYQGTYMFTSEDASPFEAMLASVGDKVIEYETKRYKQQRLVAFSNWPTTDPFVYSENVMNFFMKCGFVDTEHIKTTDAFLAGQFASYHVYPYYPDYLSYVDDLSAYAIGNPSDLITEQGTINTYRAYLNMLNNHHTMPVVISEFGVSTGRGMAQKDQNTGRNQGNMSEQEQGQAIIDCYEDIQASGCAGSIVFSWQDEWFKRTWNTMHAVDLKRTPYWSDYQTNEQYFGLLSFDPGKDHSICYVDGDVSEWKETDLVLQTEEMSLSMKYDEKFIYFMIHQPNLKFEEETIYVPLDITSKTGSNYCKNYQLRFDRGVDFVIVLDGKDNSRVQVQERYEALRSTYSFYALGYDTYLKDFQPDVDSSTFVDIDMILQTATPLIYEDVNAKAEFFETGQLLYGNANPDSADFNSLADFMAQGEYVEIKLPWQLLNFADPSRMEIHDDYYEHYGVDYLNIDEIHVGLANEHTQKRIHLVPFALQGWGNKVTFHERLKSSYYLLQSVWTKN